MAKNKKPEIQSPFLPKPAERVLQKWEKPSKATKANSFGKVHAKRKNNRKTP